MFLTKNKLCLVVPLLPAPKALIGPGEEPEGFAGSPPGRLVCATSRGRATGAPQALLANVGQRGRNTCDSLRSAACRLGAALASPTFFEAQGGSVPKFLKKVAGQAVDSSARRLVEWSAVGRSVDTRASFPSFAWGVRPSPRAHAHTRPRAKRTTFAPQGNRANLRTQEKRQNIY